MNSPNRKLAIRRFLAMTVGCLAFFMAGSFTSIVVYENAFKGIYNLTQTEVERITAVMNIGANLGFPVAFVQERFGSRCATIIGMILTVTSQGMLWIAAYHVMLFIACPFLLDILFFSKGIGCLYLYMGPMDIDVDNYHWTNSGKVIGILDAFYSASPAMLSLAYSIFYVNGHVTDEVHQDMAGFFQLNTILYLLVGLSCIVFLHRVPKDSDYSEINGGIDSPGNKFRLIEPEGSPTRNLLSGESISTAMDYDSHNSPDNKVHSHNSDSQSHSPDDMGEDVTGLALFRRLDFHCLFWAHILSNGLYAIFNYNVTIYLKAFRLERLAAALTVTVPTIETVVKLLSGVVSDYTLWHAPRAALSVFLSALSMIAFFLCIFRGDKAEVFVSACVLIPFLTGSVWSLNTTMLREYFGREYFMRNWSWLVLGNMASMVSMQLVLGSLYDVQVDAGSGTQCYGLKCFKVMFQIAFLVNVLVTVAYCVLLKVRIKKRKAAAADFDNNSHHYESQ